MAKNIVLCADGTWNRPAAQTNVNRLFNTLPGEHEYREADTNIDCHLYKTSEGQVAFYLEGVGSKGSKNDILCGATGAGLHSKVLDAYILISKVYDPFDKIYLFGFSRGAYTVRSLGGLISKVGLMEKDSALGDKSRELANNNWWAFKHKEFAINKNAPDSVDRCPIQLVGVWDTVGALGIPLFNGMNVVDDFERHWFDFADTALSERVQYGLHAVSIDERRMDYEPTLWDERLGITQIWFPGVHSDVGGGYTDKRLGDISLLWMLEESIPLGLLATAPNNLNPEPKADRHDEADGLIWKLRSADRIIPLDASFSPSVPARFQQRPDYRPRPLKSHAQFAPYYKGEPVEETLCQGDKHCAVSKLSINESKHCYPCSEKWWNAAGLEVKAGETYSIKAQGKWNDASKTCDAEGWEGYKALAMFRRIEDKPWFYLCMAVSPDPLLEFNNVNFVKGLTGIVGQMDSGSSLYPIGLRQTVTIERPGYVYFFANDAPAFYGNNSGYLNVTITRNN